MFRKTLFLLLMLLVFAPVFALPADAPHANDGYKDFLDQSGWYGGFINFLHAEAPGDSQKIRLSTTDTAICVAADIVLSFICLWVALFFVAGMRGFEIKKYLMFLLALNIGWFVIVFLNNCVWGMLEFLVLRLRPELKNALVDFFSAALVVEGVILYIWLLARNFSVNFYGALGILLVSQGIYFVVLFVFSVAAPRNNIYCNLINSSMGLVPSIREYLHDVFKIASREGALSFLRFRAFHI